MVTAALQHTQIISILTEKPSLPQISLFSRRLQWRQRRVGKPFCNSRWSSSPQQRLVRRRDEVCREGQRPFSVLCNAGPKLNENIEEEEEEGDGILNRGALKLILWAMEGAYILWLLILPFAPGDPAWAISSETINSLVCLSLNFFFILPLSNSVGIHVLEAPVLHPMSEGLFNFVIGWTFMFAPLLFTDCRRNRYKGSLDVLWGLQMFLTNAFLIPYMAIRLNETDAEGASEGQSKLGAVMTNGASIVGLIGGSVCLISILWALFSRMDGNFGTLTERWEFLVNYLGSERLAYAFIWDIVLYSIFQPWLIGDNLQNVQPSTVGIVSKLRFIPVVGLVAYLSTLTPDQEL